MPRVSHFLLCCLSVIRLCISLQKRGRYTAMRHYRTNGTVVQDTHLECDFYRQECTNGQGCQETHRCGRPPNGRSSNRPACITIWKNSTERGIEVLQKHCMLVQHLPPHSDLSCGDDECIANSASAERNSSAIYVCCCYQSRCNRHFGYVPVQSDNDPPVTGIKNTRGIRTVVHSDDTEYTTGLLYAVLPVCLLMVLVIVAYWMFRRHRLRKLLRQNLGAGYAGTVVSSPFVRLKSLPSLGAFMDSVQLDEIISKGRYGTVWKGHLRHGQTVAVKVFTNGEAESWIREQQIYATSSLRDHPNILQFIAANVRGSGTQAEYWLITAYHEHGSLHEFLKRNIITLPEALRILTSVLHGLSFLHQEDGEKPCIVHRDLKSKNVLVKAGMTACIADFGLAVKCSDCQAYDDIHTQVGTSRYMAPEVLQGATEFSAPAFRRIDVYACALVMWEVISRTDFTEDAVDQYRLPFEEYVSTRIKLQESITKLQNVVAVQKQRPLLKESWQEHPEGRVICGTIEEMWDTESEARLTAGCAVARISALQFSIQSTTPSSEVAINCDTTPLIIPGYSSDTMTNGGGVEHLPSNVECT